MKDVLVSLAYLLAAVGVGIMSVNIARLAIMAAHVEVTGLMIGGAIFGFGLAALFLSFAATPHGST